MKNLFFELLMQSLLIITFLAFYFALKKEINGVAKRLDTQIYNIKSEINDVKSSVTQIEKDVALIQQNLK
jgi:peptidoglycan hydrolase CwlO-like protein